MSPLLDFVSSFSGKRQEFKLSFISASSDTWPLSTSEQRADGGNWLAQRTGLKQGVGGSG